VGGRGYAVIKPKFEWVPEHNTDLPRSSIFGRGSEGEDWKLVDEYVCVGWAYKVHYFWSANFQYRMCEFLTLAEAAQWVEKQAGLR
jgi:hypothetical protein